MKHVLYLCFLALITVNTVEAAEPAASGAEAASADTEGTEDYTEITSPWKTEAELGFVNTTGNTETTSTAAKFDTTYEVEKWRHNIHAEAFGQETQDETTKESVVSAERYQLSGKTDYKFTELDYAFAVADLKKDRFSGFEYEHVFGVGYGRKLIKQLDMELDVEAGPGMRVYKVDNAPESEDEAVLRLSADYWWQFTRSAKFTQKLKTDIGEEFTASESITGLQAAINSTLALKLTHTIRHKSKVPVDTEKTDTETAVTLVYSFK